MMSQQKYLGELPARWLAIADRTLEIWYVDGTFRRN